MARWWTPTTSAWAAPSAVTRRWRARSAIAWPPARRRRPSSACCGRISTIAGPTRASASSPGAIATRSCAGSWPVASWPSPSATCRRAVWLNAADDPAHCTFILPAVVRRGALTISVASGGATPALTRALREHLEGALGPEWATLAELAAEARRELRATGRAVDGETWRRALAADVRALVAERRLDDARRELRTRLAIP